PGCTVVDSTFSVSRAGAPCNVQDRVRARHCGLRPGYASEYHEATVVVKAYLRSKSLCTRRRLMARARLYWATRYSWMLRFCSRASLAWSAARRARLASISSG